MSNLAYLSLGSNIEPEKNLLAAVELLARQSKLIAVSSVWETTPLGVADQSDFLNAAVVVETVLTAEQFKQNVIRPIEQRLGRVRGINKYGPRTIDIDIMFFNRDILELDDRHIPDPEVLERAFVVIPLAEIAPNYRHPETGRTLTEITRRFKAAKKEMWPRPDVSQTLIQTQIVNLGNYSGDRHFRPNFKYNKKFKTHESSF